MSEKIKITEIDLRAGKAFYNNQEINLNEIDLNESIGFDYNRIGYVQLTVDSFDKHPTMNHLIQLMYVKSLASLNEAVIIEDSSLRNEAEDGFFVDSHDCLRQILGVQVGYYYNPYGYKFEDKSRFVYNEDGTFTLDGNVCIERNNRTTEYFRDFLLLHNIDQNVLLVRFDTHESIKVLDSFTGHDYIQLVESTEEISAMDKVELNVIDELGYLGAANTTLAQILYAEITNEQCKKINEIMSMKNMVNGKYNYNDEYLILLDFKSTILKQPRLLLEYLVNNPISNEDLQYGLVRLGFNLIEI